MRNVGLVKVGGFRSEWVSPVDALASKSEAGARIVLPA